MIWLTLALLIGLSVFGARCYRTWRNRQDLRIRNAQLTRFCIIPQKGTRSTFSHSKEE